jgi:hypothetical protein
MLNNYLTISGSCYLPYSEENNTEMLSTSFWREQYRGISDKEIINLFTCQMLQPLIIPDWYGLSVLNKDPNSCMKF